LGARAKTARPCALDLEARVALLDLVLDPPMLALRIELRPLRGADLEPQVLRDALAERRDLGPERARFVEVARRDHDLVRRLVPPPAPEELVPVDRVELEIVAELGELDQLRVGRMQRLELRERVAHVLHEP